MDEIKSTLEMKLREGESQILRRPISIVRSSADFLRSSSFKNLQSS